MYVERRTLMVLALLLFNISNTTVKYNAALYSTALFALNTNFWYNACYVKNPDNNI